MASGKQILLHLIQKFSQKRSDPKSLRDVSEDIRFGFLVHGSTAPDSWFDAERIAWISDTDENEYVRQGIGLRGSKYFLSDIVHELTCPDEIPAHIAEKFPDLTTEEYHSISRMIFLITIACEYHSSLESVENGGAINLEELERFRRSYHQKMKNFREAPSEYLTGMEGVDEYHRRYERIRRDLEE